ncbi:hypothetical protein SprV_0501831600 [Sparganum proliferum]
MEEGGRGFGRGGGRGGRRAGGSEGFRGQGRGRGDFQRGRGDFHERGGGEDSRDRGGDFRGQGEDFRGRRGDFRGRGGEFRGGRGGRGEEIREGGRGFRGAPRGGNDFLGRGDSGRGGRGRGFRQAASEAADASVFSPGQSAPWAKGPPPASEISETPSASSPMSPDEPLPTPSPQPPTAAAATAGQGREAKQKKKGPKGVIPQMKSLTLESSGPILDILPKRPDGGGTLGRPVTVEANCWDMTIKDTSVLMYHIKATAVSRMSNGKKKQLPSTEKGLREHLQEIIKRLPNTTFYDGDRIIYSVNPLPGITEQGLTKEEPIPDQLERDELVLEYVIKQVGRVSARRLLEYVGDRNSCTFNIPQDSINMVDCILKNVNKSNYVMLGRTAAYYKEPMKVIGHKLFVIYRGFLASCRPQWKVRLNIDMVHRAFFPSGNLADVLYDKYGDAMSDPRCWQEMARDIHGIRCEAGHYKNDNGIGYKRRFTVQGLSRNSADREMIEEKKVSVAAYFQEKYGITLKYPELPCVKTKKDRADFVPMELLIVLPYQSPKADKGDIASEVIRCAAVRPHERFQELYTYVNEFVKKQNELTRLFQLTINPLTPVKVPARVLPQPRAEFGDGSMELGRGKWNTQRFAVNPNPSIKWAIVAVPPHNFAQRDTGRVANELPRCGRQFGVQFDPAPLIRRATFAELRNVFRTFVSQGIQLAIFVLYDNQSYSEIKRLGDLEIGLKTQCVKSQTLGKPNVFPNLLLKINGKLGGVNWIVNDLRRNDDLLMVLGADVTHPGRTRGDELQKSVAAVIGSLTPDLMQYAAVIRQQNTTKPGDKARQEVIVDMESIITDLLKAFGRKNNDRLPMKIMFYRDGVSEGEFRTVLHKELRAIQRACRLLRPDYEPAITFIVVQKRHHIRFKPMDPRSRNVDPGTVVDREVTHASEFDFFLCSQEGIQGTSKPAHYHVLYDDSNWSSDALQSFTYYLCHAYQRCCRSVSYPAPAFYSHLAAFRARDWLKDCQRPAELFVGENKFKVNSSQENFMFFL